MGFGSYDESEQENQNLDAEDIEESESREDGAAHEGEVEFDFDETSSEELVDRLQNIK